jgi:exonuclease III
MPTKDQGESLPPATSIAQQLRTVFLSLNGLAHPKEINRATNTTHNNINTQQTRYETDGFGTPQTLGGGNMSATADHKTNDTLRGLAGRSNPNPQQLAGHQPSRRIRGQRRRRPPYHNNNNNNNETRQRTNNSPRMSNNPINKNTRANIRLMTLNIQGRGSNSIYDERHKWHAINRMLVSEKIGILCLQETHLTQDQTDEINNVYTNVKIFSSIDPNQPNAQGVAIALNGRITNMRNVKVTDMIPGRAILMELPWHKNEILTILNIYAPNESNKNKDFWKNLNEKWSNRNSTLPFPDIMTGDFNMTEDQINGSNGANDPTETTNAIAKLKQSLNHCD